jgi:hypothetical protein
VHVTDWLRILTYLAAACLVGAILGWAGASAVHSATTMEIPQ